MGSIGWYIFRTTLGAFLLILLSLTAVIWLATALRDIDLMTNQGQTILVFLGITSLVIPQLMLVIAPVALVIAAAHVLNKLATDSELIVMNAAGMSPWRLFRAFLAVAGVVCAMVLVFSAYVSPQCLRELRRLAAEVRADFVANIVQPGRFIPLERGLTFHIRERQQDGLLLGVFLDDRRDPHQQTSILAEQGKIVQNKQGTFLFLQTGSIQRHLTEDRDPTIVLFERYAFDLSRLAGSPQPMTEFLVREHYTWELLAPAPNDPARIKQPGNFRAETHDRIVAPLYPIVFMIVAYAYLGAPRTTRQSRTLSMVSAISAVAAIRMVGFASMVLGINSPIALTFQYIAILIATGLGLIAISQGTIIEPPAFVLRAVNFVTERLSRRLATT
ncbi:MAG TPA: LPS export ABC transporter permease LptF [Xanthobacteraceae bacterium]|nr:LPS export ABC transporter permease LptF [Xanthobacteraceae bacterium]